MNALDLRGVGLAIALTSTIFAFVLWWLGRMSNRENTHDGLRLAGQGVGAIAAGSLLAVYRAQLPESIGIVASNVLLIMGYLLHAAAVNRLVSGRRDTRVFLGLALLVVLHPFIQWWLDTPDGVRVVFALAIHTCIMVLHVQALVTYWRTRSALPNLARSGSSLALALLWTIDVVMILMLVARMLSIAGQPATWDQDFLQGDRLAPYYALTTAAWVMFANVGVLLLVSEMTQQQLRQLAYTDTLTGLLNRRAFLLSVAQERTAYASDADGHSTVALCDLDHFKRVNDTYGHAGGDAVLKAWAATADVQLRSHGIRYLLGRFGGEEFAIWLATSDGARARDMLERLRATLAATPVTVGLPDGPLALSVTASFGAAVWDGRMAIDVAFSQADQALYRAKLTRNAVVMADSISP